MQANVDGAWGMLCKTAHYFTCKTVQFKVEMITECAG